MILPRFSLLAFAIIVNFAVSVAYAAQISTPLGKTVVVGSFGVAKIEPSVNRHGETSTFAHFYSVYHTNISTDYDTRCTLSILDIAAPGSEIASLKDYISQYMDSGFAQNVDLPLPGDFAYERFMRSERNLYACVVEQISRKNYASELKIESHTGEDGLVRATGYIAIDGTVFKFIATNSFRRRHIENAILNIKELMRDIVSMLFHNNPSENYGINNEATFTVEDLQARSRSYAQLYPEAASMYPTYAPQISMEQPRPEYNPTTIKDTESTDYTFLYLFAASFGYAILLWWKRTHPKVSVVNEHDAKTGAQGNYEDDMLDDEQEFTPEECYAFFELENGADFETVKHRYRLMAQIYHPDKIVAEGAARDWALEKFRKINAAYAILKTQLGG